MGLDATSIDETVDLYYFSVTKIFISSGKSSEYVEAMLPKFLSDTSSHNGRILQ